jgi:hypothetical protein
MIDPEPLGQACDGGKWENGQEGYLSRATKAELGKRKISATLKT